MGYLFVVYGDLLVRLFTLVGFCVFYISRVLVRGLYGFCGFLLDFRLLGLLYVGVVVLRVFL